MGRYGRPTGPRPVSAGRPRGAAVTPRDARRSRSAAIALPAGGDQSAGHGRGKDLELYRAFGAVEHDRLAEPGLAPTLQDGEGAAQFHVFHLEGAPPEEESPTGQCALEAESGEQQLDPFTGRQSRQ